MDAEEGEAAAAPGLGAESTLEALQERWGADPRWQVRGLGDTSIP